MTVVCGSVVVGAFVSDAVFLDSVAVGATAVFACSTTADGVGVSCPLIPVPVCCESSVGAVLGSGLFGPTAFDSDTDDADTFDSDADGADGFDPVAAGADVLDSGGADVDPDAVSVRPSPSAPEPRPAPVSGDVSDGADVLDSDPDALARPATSVPASWPVPVSWRASGDGVFGPDLAADAVFACPLVPDGLPVPVRLVSPVSPVDPRRFPGPA